MNGKLPSVAEFHLKLNCEHTEKTARIGGF
jgi:hypothetical protein